jgi:hypothetical protein
MIATFRTEDELRKALSDFAIQSGQNPAAVQRSLQGDTGDMTVGQRAQAHLDAYMADPGFRAKLESGDTTALDLFNAYSIGIAFQQGQDREAQYLASVEGIKQAEAERAEADKAAASAAAADGGNAT